MTKLLSTTAVVVSLAFATAAPASAWTLSGVTSAVSNTVSSLWSSVTGGNKTYYGQPIDWRYTNPAPTGKLTAMWKTVNGKRIIVGYSYAVTSGTGTYNPDNLVQSCPC
jgi:protein-disulfide isomerase